MSSIRQNKVARLLQKEISEIFQLNEGNWFPQTMISVTVVRVAPDLSFAKVYLSIFGKMNATTCIELITKHVKMIRRELAKRVGKQLKNTPEIAFYIDDSIDYAEEIESLLKG